MLSHAQQEHIRQIEIITQKLFFGRFGGDHVTRRRGLGAEFYQLREYVCGDDIRFVDWKSSARLGHLLTRECFQDKNRTIIIALDISNSQRCGRHKTKVSAAQDAAAVLTFAALHAHDRVGLILFSDKIHTHLPPATGYGHASWLIQSIYESYAHGTTDLAGALASTGSFYRQDAIVFIISDFIAPDFKNELAWLAQRTDAIAIRCLDEVERSFPTIGCIQICDSEKGQLIDVDKYAAQHALTSALSHRLTAQNAIFSSNGIDCLDIQTNDDICAQLVQFFRKRTLVGGYISS